MARRTKGSSSSGSPRGGRPPERKDATPKAPSKRSASRRAPLAAEERFRRTWKGPRLVGFEIGESTEPSREIEAQLRGAVTLRPERERAGLAHNTPEALDAIERALWEALARRLEAEFLASENALYPWKAWALARELGRPVPEWALAYLDAIAERLLDCARRPPANVGRALGRALGFRVSRGRGSELAAFGAFRRNVAVADTVRLAREGGATWEQAFAVAAGRHRMSESSARDTWRELRALLPRRASFWARGAQNRGRK